MSTENASTNKKTENKKASQENKKAKVLLPEEDLRKKTTDLGWNAPTRDVYGNYYNEKVVETQTETLFKSSLTVLLPSSPSPLLLLSFSSPSPSPLLLLSSSHLSPGCMYQDRRLSATRLQRPTLSKAAVRSPTAR